MREQELLIRFPNLKKEDPKIYKELDKYRNILEKHYKEMLDIEFTIQQGKLWMLQCRVGKRTGFAAIRMAVDMVKERFNFKRRSYYEN